MTRTWDMYKEGSRRCHVQHPFLASQSQLQKVIAANHEALSIAGKPETISLALGDPALDGNLPPPPIFDTALKEAIASEKCNGYTSSIGLESTRAAVADYWTRDFAPSLKDSANPITANDVVLTSGTSDAITIMFGAIAGPGDRILLPEPYFPRFELTVGYYNIEPLYYRCDPEHDWEVDLPALRAQVEANTGKPIKTIVLNNPSNPCGSNFSRSHVEDIIKLCEELDLPIISDEIYAGITFTVPLEEGSEAPTASPPFTSVADIASDLPRFITAGLSKIFCVPGERVGWIMLIDPAKRAQRVMTGVRSLTARYLLPNHLVQVATTAMLPHVNQSCYDYANRILQRNSIDMYHALRKTGVLQPVVPAGGMFMSVLLKPELLKEEVQDGVRFAERLAAEENVLVFPGEPFRMPAALRLTISRPPEVIEEALRRIIDFCERYKK
uniref:Tyrosine transaminase n=1 Tax=Strigomonas galati TaxID=1003336 RepID=T1YRQ3_9TRYP|nr:tyrosine transaminase [Strigomonas galati]